jgi:hypothetical protein
MVSILGLVNSSHFCNLPCILPQFDISLHVGINGAKLLSPAPYPPAGRDPLMAAGYC